LTDDAGENTHEDVDQQFAADWMVIIEANSYGPENRNVQRLECAARQSVLQIISASSYSSGSPRSMMTE
jgi:hypothetical protein